MARYDVVRAWFATPNGRSAMMHVRLGTNDWNTCYASMNEDEYGLRGRRVTGSAIDIGGYLGTVAIGLLVDNPGLRVECVEPLPENVDLIWRNARLNGVADRLFVHEAAVGNGQPAVVNYAYEGDENELHHAFVGNASIVQRDLPHRSVTVPTLTPSDFGPASFVKIDCEGGEWDFFAAGDTSKFERIVGERHPAGGTRDDLRALLPGHDVTFTGPEGGPDEFVAVRV